MSYQKRFIDNVTCSRRFHLAYDDEATKVAQVTLDCPHCGTVVWEEANHPPISFIREENLIKTTRLSDDITSACSFEDRLSQKTVPGYNDKANDS